MAQRNVIMKYDPDYHKNVVDNYRRAYKLKYQEESKLSDERIWFHFETNSSLDECDEAVLEDMKGEQLND